MEVAGVSFTESIYSDQWYRVAAVRPTLVSHVRIDRHKVRGETWYVLTGEDDGQGLRLDSSAYVIAARCDGSRTVEELWNTLNELLGDAAPTQDEVLQILLALHARQWVEFDQGIELESVAREKRRQNGRLGWQSLNPIALRLPLLDLRPWLRRWGDAADRLADRLYSPTALTAWFLIVGSGALAVLFNLSDLVTHAGRWLATPGYLLLGVCIYPVIKIVHEMAHGLAIRRWRGDLREAGITLLAFIPVPYIDASAANRFPCASQRATVSLAGIAAELILAATATWLWLWLDDGMLRDASFLVIVISGVSTVLVNANPLLRFDGYFAFCDLLGLPNLATRSQRWWQELVDSRLLGLQLHSPLRPARGERGWLLAYAPLSWCYQAVLAIALTGWLAGVTPVLGVLAGILFAVLLLAQPARRIQRSVASLALAPRERSKAVRRGGLAAALALACFALVPLPDRTTVQGVTWIPENATLRAGADGFVERVLVHDGARLEPGQLVAVLSNPALTARAQSLEARITGLEIALFRALQEDTSRARQAREELIQASGESTLVARDLAGLELRATMAGTLAMSRPSDLPGSYAHRGDMLAYVLTGDQPTVRVAIPQDQAAGIRTDDAALRVRLAAHPGAELVAHLQRDGGGAQRLLPSAALSTRHGGNIVTDPADTTHRRTLAPVVMMDIQLETPATADSRIGERAWVRFDNGLRPLGWQWFRAAEQWRHRHFDGAR